MLFCLSFQIYQTFVYPLRDNLTRIQEPVKNGSHHKTHCQQHQFRKRATAGNWNALPRNPTIVKGV